jgi:colanic acid biosynthesis protein WcaH
VSIDIIIRDRDQNTLLGLRNNEPAKGTYFVPGGIVRKNERIGAAFARILKAETGVDKAVTEADFVGVFEHMYGTNTFGHPDFGTHYVVLAYELKLTERPTVIGDAQHTGFRWMSVTDILSAVDVHPNTQAYFRYGDRHSNSCVIIQVPG